MRVMHIARTRAAAATAGALTLLLAMFAQPAATQALPNSTSATTVQDFSATCGAGPTLTNTTITEDGDGEIALKATLEDYFRNTSLDTATWATGAYGATAPAVAQQNDELTITSSPAGGSYVRSIATQRRGILEADVTFSAGRDQHFGWGAPGFSSDQYLIFSTYTTSDTIFARSNNVGIEERTPVGTVGGTKRLRIEWTRGSTTDQIDYYIDNVLMATHQVDKFATGSMYVHLSTNSQATLPLSAKWIRYAPYNPASGSYLSCPLSVAANKKQVWSTVDWAESVPPGTSLALALRTANDPASLAAATFTTVANGVAYGGPEGVYAQYRVTLITTTPFTATPKLSSISLASTPFDMLDQVAPNSAKYGTQFLVSGDGFDSDAALSVAFDGRPASAPALSANQFGEFAFYADSTDASVGAHTVTVSGPGHAPITLDFSVGDAGGVPAPVPGASATFAMPESSFAPVPITPAEGLPGTTFVAQSSGFARGATVNVSLDGSSIGTTTANSNGQINYTLDSTGLVKGPHSLAFDGPFFKSAGTLTVPFEFTIVDQSKTYLPLLLR
jgi:hypothetical protein